jgi:hypothetical protein
VILRDLNAGRISGSIVAGQRPAIRRPGKGSGAIMEVLVALIVLVSLGLGTCAGFWAQYALPRHHMTPDTKDVVKVGVGSIATLTALVLGLLVASTKGSFDAKATDIHQFSSSLIEIDRSLAYYGPGANDARGALKAFTALKLATTWPDESHMTQAAATQTDNTEGVRLLETLGTKLRELKPATDVQKAIQSRALSLYYNVTDERWGMAVQSASTAQTVFLVLLIFWLTVMFASFGMFAPGNGTAVFFLLLCAMSFSGAIYIVLEMNGPFSGLITISSEPMREALARMGQP